MKRRDFLTLIAMAAPAMLAPSVSNAFEIGLPGGMKVDTDKLMESHNKRNKKVYTYEGMSPEQEYYVGRSVAAIILGKFTQLDHDRAQKYVNVMGQTLALASDRPETFGGYRFMILDTDEIHALSAPGGFVFVTKGLLKHCKTEDEMASVLAHEIGHIQRQHGLQALTKSQVKLGIATLAIPGTEYYSEGIVTDLSKTLEDGANIIVDTMTQDGYSQEFEEEADSDTVTILQRVGYDPNAFIDLLRKLEANTKPGSNGFTKTHPAPADRIQQTEKLIGGYNKPKKSTARKFRFMAMTGGM